MTDETTAQQRPQPDPALRQLDFLVGTWSMRGHLIGSDEENIVGEATFEWLQGGFFLRQLVELDFAGMFKVESEELIRYDPETGRFPSYVFSNLSPEPLPYEYDVKDGSMKITVSHGVLDATFTGGVGDDGDSFSGGWRPNPGADETVNVPYDISGTRIKGGE
jgi:Protein of unknown function (DUF1579)